MAHTYSNSEDLLTGNIPLPAYVDVDKTLQDTADEIDSHIGFLYKTPIDITEQSTVVRPARLLLKRISTHIASGRIMMAAAASDDEVHKYGAYLLRQGLDALKQIVAGKIVLEGAELIDADESVAHAPLIGNLDEESQVEAFYEHMRTPTTFGTARLAGG